MKTRFELKLCTIVCLLLVVFMLPAYAQADSRVDAEVVYSSKDGMQYAVSPSGLWFNENGQLKWFGMSDFEPSLAQTDENVSHIDTDTSSLFYLVDTPDGQYLHSVLPSGTVMMADVLIQSDAAIVQMEAGQYVLDENGKISSLYAYEGTLSPLQITSWSNRDVSAFSVWDTYLITYKASTGELALLDTSKKQLACSPMKISALAWVQVGKVSDESVIALALNETGDLLRIDMKNGTYETLNTNLPKDCAGLRRNETTVYTLGKNCTVLYSLPVSQLLGKETGKTLTVVNAMGTENHYQAAIDLFHQKYPDVDVVYRGINDPHVLATEIMGGQEGIDIVGLQDAYMSTSSALLLKSGAFLDLNQFDELVAQKEAYRDIFDTVTIDGIWYAMPLMYYQNPWQVNKTLAEQIGWEIPAGRWTWDDFMLLAKKVKAWNETADSHIYLLQDDNPNLPYFFTEYQANHVNTYAGVADYQSEAYLQLLTMWKQLNDDKLLYSPPLRQSQSIMMPRNVLLYTELVDLRSMGSKCYIYPPTETLDSPIPVYSITCAALNANTPYLEEAVHFLACYMSPEAAARSDYWGEGQLLKDKSLYSTDMSWGASVSAENETLWNDMLTQGAPELFLYDISNKQRNTLLPGLLDGTVSVEQFAAVSQQLADMALGE